jgi:hypothetical protein
MAKGKQSTFLKNPLDSLATHAGKFIDRMTIPQLLDLLGAGISVYYGWKAIPDTLPYEERGPPSGGGVGGEAPTPIEWKLGGASLGLISYQLARANNLAAGASGTIGLAAIGLCNLPLEDIARRVAAATNPITALQDAWKRLTQGKGPYW